MFFTRLLMLSEPEGQESRSIATDEHGITRKENQAEALATEISRSRRICHGLTRNYTEKTEAETRKQNTSFRAGCVSDGSFLRRRTQLFIAYLYKPEAQAKVLQIHVYYSYIIPSLALVY